MLHAVIHLYFSMPSGNSISCPRTWPYGSTHSNSPGCLGRGTNWLRPEEVCWGGIPGMQGAELSWVLSSSHVSPDLLHLGNTDPAAVRVAGRHHPGGGGE